MFFQRFFTAWYLVFALLSGSVWAIGVHQDDGNSLSSADNGLSHLLSQDEDGCDDHCCHAVAHTVAFPVSSMSFISPCGSNFHPVSTVQLYPYPTPPPYHPPIS